MGMLMGGAYALLMILFLLVFVLAERIIKSEGHIGDLINSHIYCSFCGDEEHRANMIRERGNYYHKSCFMKKDKEKKKI